jgi:single-strand selective monofunctional uracil DNA glycosylase
MSLVDVSRRLAKAVDRLAFAPPVTHVYNPLVYAWAPHKAYVERFGQGAKEALFLGMNPGPFGMAQTGVPFGDVSMVEGFVGVGTGVERKVGQPAKAHPKRAVTGFDCTRREVSGTRFWGWAQNRFTAAPEFFARFFVVNYCPLVFMDEGGRNVTPDKLPAQERAPLFAVCDEALRQMVVHLQPQWVIGVGAFAQKRAEEALQGTRVSVGTILHPSPASPAANRDWQGQIEKQLKALGLQLP